MPGRPHTWERKRDVGLSRRLVMAIPSQPAMIFFFCSFRTSGTPCTERWPQSTGDMAPTRHVKRWWGEWYQLYTKCKGMHAQVGPGAVVLHWIAAACCCCQARCVVGNALSPRPVMPSVGAGVLSLMDAVVESWFCRWWNGG